MRVWLERFVLAVCAAAFIGVVLLNTMKLDWTERITLALAIVFFSFFTAHWLHRQGRPQDEQQTAPTSVSPQEPPFAADVLISLIGEGQVWAVYRSSYGNTVAPVSTVLLIRIVNTQNRPASLHSLLVELKTQDGWMLLKRIPLRGVRPFLGPLKSARLVEFSPGDIHDIVDAKPEIRPGETVRGIGLFEYSNRSYVFPGGSATFRITLEDSAHHRAVTESTPGGSPSADPFAQFDSLAIKGTETSADLSKFTLKRFSKPVQ